jgi:hypothetical protein
MKFVTIYNGLNPAEVNLVYSRLEAADFHPFIPDENAAFVTDGYTLSIGGMRLQVPEDEVADAKEFLEAPTE